MNPWAQIQLWRKGVGSAGVSPAILIALMQYKIRRRDAGATNPRNSRSHLNET